MRWESNTVFTELLARSATIDALLARLDRHAATPPSKPLRAPRLAFARRTEASGLPRGKLEPLAKSFEKKVRKAEERSMALFVKQRIEKPLDVLSSRREAKRALGASDEQPRWERSGESLASYERPATRVKAAFEVFGARTPGQATSTHSSIMNGLVQSPRLTAAEGRFAAQAATSRGATRARRVVVPLAALQPAAEFSRSVTRSFSPDASESRWENTHQKIDELRRDVRRLAEREAAPAEFQ